MFGTVSRMPSRSWHYWTPLYRPSLPYQIIALDIRSSVSPDWSVQSAIATRYRWRDGRECKPIVTSLSTRDATLQYLESSAANGSCSWVVLRDLQTDAHTLRIWNMLEAKCITPISLVASPGCGILHYGYGDGTIKLLDIHNWYPDRRKLEQLVRDTGMSLAELVYRWVAIVLADRLGTLSVTAASQASTWYRTAYMTTPPLVCGDEDIVHFERAGYYGDECLCNRVGVIRGPIYKIDVNGLYPYAMVSHTQPYRCIHRKCDLLPNVAQRHLRDYVGVAWVRIHSTRRTYPRLRNDTIQYIYGEYDTVLTTPDLEDALASGDCVYVYRLQVYETRDMFATYMNECATRRKHAQDIGDRLRSFIYKTLGVSLYGKTGQRAYQWQDAPDSPHIRPWGQHVDIGEDGIVRVYRAVNDMGQERVDVGESPHSIPIVSAITTGWSRWHMRMLREIVGPEDWYYQGTDMLLVSQMGLDRLSNTAWYPGGNAGQLKLESTHEEIEIKGAKCYRQDDRWIVAGIGPESVSVGHGRVLQIYRLSLDYDLMRGRPEAPQSVTREITYPVAQIGGIVDVGGWVHPYVVQMDPEPEYPCRHKRIGDNTPLAASVT